MDNISYLSTKDIHISVLLNPVHLITIFSFSLICSLCLFIEYFSIIAMVFTLLFMLIYYIIKLLKNIWFWLIVIGCLIFPFITPFVVIFLIIVRITYLWDHKLAVFYGIFLYLIPLVINLLFTQMGRNLSFYYNQYMILISFLVFLMTTLIIHLFLFSLYKKGYVVKNAIILMLEFPILIFLLLLSVCGILDGHLFDKPVNDFHGHDGHIPNNHYTDPHFSDHPGYHDVHAYVRQGANGDMQFVKAHIRSNPDGIIENNISYRGY